MRLIERLLKFMKHAESHTYRKHVLGYAIKSEVVGEGEGRGGIYYNNTLKYSTSKDDLIYPNARKRMNY